LVLLSFELRERTPKCSVARCERKCRSRAAASDYPKPQLQSIPDLPRFRKQPVGIHRR
jgi:hypothetical protein